MRRPVMYGCALACSALVLIATRADLLPWVVWTVGLVAGLVVIFASHLRQEQDAYGIALMLQTGASCGFAISMRHVEAAVAFGILALATLALLFQRPKLRFAALAGLLVMVSFSAYIGGAAGGAGITRMVLHAVFGLNGHDLDVANVIARKTIHFTWYGSVGVVACFASLEPFRRWFTTNHLGGILTVVCIGGLDEYRQSYEPSRTSSIYDVCIDVSGAICMVLLMAYIVHRRTRTLDSAEPKGLR